VLVSTLQRTDTSRGHSLLFIAMHIKAFISADEGEENEIGKSLIKRMNQDAGKFRE
jgi:hypothetical protein